MGEHTPVEPKNPFAVTTKHLNECAETIRRELASIHSLFAELTPRCTLIGKTFSRAKGFFGNDTKGFYSWSESNFGIKERQVRTYIAFAKKVELIKEKAEGDQIHLTSMEQGLALLKPTPEPTDSDTDSARMQALTGAAGRAKGAMIRALDTAFEIVGTTGLDPDQRDTIEQAIRILSYWSEATVTPEGNLALPATVTNQPKPEWTDPPTTDANTPTKGFSSVLTKAGLPVGTKPGQWKLGQLEQALALCDDNQTALANAIGYTKAAVSSQLKKKRAKAASSTLKP